jgi:hypothetical protein
MTFRLEYDWAVRRLIPASVAAFVLCAGMVFVSQSYAQGNGAASVGASAGASSGSSGSAGHSGGSAAAAPPSGASHGQSGQSGPGGHAPGSGTTHSGSGGNHSGSGENHGQPTHHHHSGESIPYIGYVIAVPYAVDQAATDDDADADDDAEYQGGPTVFDRRGSGADSYVPPVSDVPMPHAAEQAEAEAAADEAPAEQPQPPTVLVFKDGHDIEVGNYAIVGETLFDLTPGHARRVALADLDLEATRKQNDDRGVVFELPASPQAN